MKTILTLGMLYSLSLCHEFSSPHITHLTSQSYLTKVVDNTTSTLRENPHTSRSDWLIMFYAPWCGHCKRLTPIFSDFANYNHHRINVAAVDCDTDDSYDLCTAFDVTGYPRVLYLNGDKHYRFKGERTVENFEEFINHGIYKEAEAKSIPFQLAITKSGEGSIEKQKGMQSHISLLIEQLFIMMGLVTVPKEIQFVLVGIALAIPVGLIQKFCFKSPHGEEDDSAPLSKKQREKLD
ncbi:hypothetical protein FGO68_gene8662 [Halteria grandinella]|uniref:Thioredoxin domain-containing protein n=1 Tax=Halteria grandinella TaxID=5974 RepID=A0A8J8NJW1_HALGN|nr:hypothetical protein FGO68_gene8662 [Halteria grandinella]